MTPQVSVILPVYNGAPYLNEAINSILQQSFTDFELIIINDGSTDNSLSIIKDFSDPRIHVIDQPNIEVQGGNFMTNSYGMITITNFPISLKSLYLLMIPFPWFQSNKQIEIIDHYFQNLDSIYYANQGLKTRIKNHKKQVNC